jgi:hypothetical protein
VNGIRPTGAIEGLIGAYKNTVQGKDFPADQAVYSAIIVSALAITEALGLIAEAIHDSRGK